MAFVCPKCAKSFESERECPQCRVALVRERPARSGSLPHVAPVEKWHQTPFGRVVAGVIMAAGFGFALLQLGIGVLHFLVAEPDQSPIAPALGLTIVFGALGCAALASGWVAGIGQSRGAVFGFTIGVLSGAAFAGAMHTGWLSLILQPALGDALTTGSEDAQQPIFNIPMRAAVLYGTAGIMVLTGSIGGFIGSRFWRPPPGLAGPVFMPVRSATPQELASSAGYRASGQKAPPSQWSGSLTWSRVFAGVVVAVVGAVLSKRILGVIVAASEGVIKFGNVHQEEVAMRIVFAFAVLLGATFSGAITPNGGKQGTVTGVLAGLCQIGILAQQQRLDESLVFVVFSMIVLGPLGGWFGSNLLPPAPPARQTSCD